MTFVIHVASPFPQTVPKDENDLIAPAVEGTQSVLKACVAAKTVRRVVLTSSCVAVNCEYSFLFFEGGHALIEGRHGGSVHDAR